MHRLRRRDVGLAISCAGLAGFVDAIGFLSMGGYFVSFMSGNTTRAAVDVALVPHQALQVLGLIASFVSGVVCGSLVGSRFPAASRRPAILALVSGALSISALSASMSQQGVAILVAAGAMGAENVTFERDGEVAFGLTYMTGALVKLGQRAAAALLGGSRWQWLPYALLWLGLFTGAVLGAMMFRYIGLSGLWFGSILAAVLAVAARYMR